MSSTISSNRGRNGQESPEVIFEEAPAVVFGEAPAIEFSEADPASPRAKTPATKGRLPVIAADDLDEVEEATWWDSIKEAPAWAVSLGVHVGVLLLLGTISMATEYLVTEDIVSMPVEEVVDEQTYKFESTVQDNLGNDSDMNKLSPSLAAATLSSLTPTEAVMQKLEQEQIINVDAPSYDIVTEPSRATLTEHYAITGTTDHPGGTEGAMDRMAFEIANALRDNKVLVTWMFDASLSVKERRDMIADRFQNIYKQVGLQGLGEGDTLLTSAVTFGEKTTFMIDEPTSDITELVQKIKEIPADESGKEMVFTAIEQLVAKWGKFRTREKRDMMIVIVTDERGDDFSKMESVIRDLSRQGIRVYCIGNAAVFGKEKGFVNYTWMEGNQQFTDDLPVDQGPETMYPELLNIDFWGLSDTRRLNQLSSSYGPYPLNRLCYETKGLYLVTQESAGAVTYDYAVMRTYQPDYSPIAQLNKEIAGNKAIAALVTASNKLYIDRLSMPTLLFDAETDNILRTELFEAQQPVSVLDYKIDEILRILEEGEKDREKITNPRWAAAYDLAMGRALALKVRLAGYGQLLAEMRTGIKPLTLAGSNAWLLQPTTDTKSLTPNFRKMAKKSEEYLQRVMNDHPGTPWATLAEAEYSQAMGWMWTETVIPKENVAMRNMQNNDPALLLAEQEARRREMQRRPRPTNPPKL